MPAGAGEPPECGLAHQQAPHSPACWLARFLWKTGGSAYPAIWGHADLAGAREEDMWRRAVACALVAGTDVRDLSDRAKDLLDNRALPASHAPALMPVAAVALLGIPGSQPPFGGTSGRAGVMGAASRVAA